MMNTSLEIFIRDARPDDAAAIVAIFNPIIKAGCYTAFDQPFTVEEERAFIENLPERGIFHVAVRPQDGQILGFQSMTPFPGDARAFAHVGIVATYVDLNYRRHGIAKHLFAATFAAARTKGYEKLFTYVRADNVAGLATYLNQGFRIVGTAQQHAKIRGRYVDEVIIERFL
jgi:L-amino acid N-acyltransferase YncA